MAGPCLSDKELDLLLARLNFYESGVDLLHEKLPVYLGKQSRVSNGTQALVKALRDVASNEPDRRMQNALFLFANKHEVLEKARNEYRSCESDLLQELESAKRMQISPMRTLIEQSPQMQKNSPIRRADPELGVHSRFFDTHRLRTVKKTARKLLVTDLRYHAKVVEELSAVLAAVDSIDA